MFLPPIQDAPYMQCSAVGQYLRVKTGVLQCTIGDTANDALVWNRIVTLLLDITPDMVHVCLAHRLRYAAKFLGAHHAMTALHEAHAKAKRLQEPAMDVTEKMMQWDANDPLMQPKRPKPDRDSTSATNKNEPHRRIPDPRTPSHTVRPSNLQPASPPNQVPSQRC